MVVVPDAAHLIPQEQPDRLAGLVLEFIEKVGPFALPPRFVGLIGSDRVSDRTRRAMLNRHFGPAPADGGVLNPTHRAVLSAMIARILPDAGDPDDLMRRLDVGLASGQSDGWRFAVLPSDAEAWRRGLDEIAAMAPEFATLTPERQDDILSAISQGDWAETSGLSALSLIHI